MISEDVFIHGSAVVIGNVRVGKVSSAWPGAVIRADFNRVNALLYVELAKKYRQGDKKMNPEEFISLMQNLFQGQE